MNTPHITPCRMTQDSFLLQSALLREKHSHYKRESGLADRVVFIACLVVPILLIAGNAVFGWRIGG